MYLTLRFVQKEAQLPSIFHQTWREIMILNIAKVCLRRLIIAIEDLTKHFKNMKCHNV